MGLRRQLLLVALITLALPWAGCEYLKEVEKTLRQGQLNALQVTAHSVAARFSSDKSMLSAIADPIWAFSREDLEHVFYAHSLKGHISVDGYSGDWSQLGFFSDPELSSSVLNEKGGVQIFTSQDGESLYALIRVSDNNRQFYDPSIAVSAADHVEILLGGHGQDTRTFRLFSAASGTLVAEERDDTSGHWLRQHQVSGFWNEQGSSYDVELKIPLSWAVSGMKINVLDGLSAAEPKSSSVRSDAIASAISPVIVPRDVFRSALEVFQRQGVRLYLSLPNGWVLAAVGDFRLADDSKGLQPWFRKFIRKVIDETAFPERVEADIGGRLFGEELDKAQVDGTAVQWYQSHSRIVARVVATVRLPNGLLASVVAEESTDSVEMLTTGAFGRLLFYCFVATLVVTVVLLFYATLISYRIRRLSTDVQHAVDEDGRVRGAFKVSRRADEIGELSRIYGAMLQRQSSYTAYLESLSSKLSHELKTPLAIVSTSLDNLHFYTLPSAQRVYVDRASEGVQRLSSILGAMSAAARVEQTIQQAETEQVEVVELFRQIFSAYKDLYPANRMEVSLPEEQTVYLLASPELLVQMLDKLVENAVDFSGEGGRVWFDVSLRAQHLLVRVMNDGPLLAKDMNVQIFDSLVSVRSELGQGAKAAQSHHLGLGLYIARLIACFHKGDLRAYNHSDGDRVVFEIDIPLS